MKDLGLLEINTSRVCLYLKHQFDPSLITIQKRTCLLIVSSVCFLSLIRFIIIIKIRKHTHTQNHPHTHPHAPACKNHKAGNGTKNKQLVLFLFFLNIKGNNLVGIHIYMFVCLVRKEYISSSSYIWFFSNKGCRRRCTQFLNNRHLE